MAIGKIAAHSAYNVFSWCGCLIVGLVFSPLWWEFLFLIAPFPDHCLRLPFHRNFVIIMTHIFYMYINTCFAFSTKQICKHIFY